MTSSRSTVVRAACVLALLGLVTIAGCTRDSRAPTALPVSASAASLDRVGAGNGDEAESDDTDAVKYSLVVATAAGTADAGVVFSPQPVIEFVKRNGRVGNADEDVTASLIGGPGRLLGLTTVQTRAGVARFSDLRISLPGAYTVLFSAAGAIAVRISIVVGSANDFALAVSPTSVALTPGSSRSVTVSTSVTAGAAQSISFALSGLPAGVTGSVSPASVTAGGSATLTLTASANAAFAATSATVSGTASSGTHSTSLAVSVIAPVPSDFAIAAVPTAVSITRGTSKTVTVATAVTAGAPQSISLAISGLPSGVTGSVSPASVTAGGSATLTLNISASAALGTATATISGSAVSGVHTASVSLTVIAPLPNDFSVAAFPSSVTLAPGTSKVVTVSTAVTSGAPQSISMSVSVLPVGVSGTFSPTSVAAGGSATLTLTASATAAVGSANVSVTGVAVSGTHAAAIALIVTPRVVNDFAIQAVPASITVIQGTTLTVTLVTAVTSGATQPVSLSLSGLPAGVSGSVSPAIVAAGGSATVTLIASSAAALGSASVTLTGTAVSGTHTAALGVTVAAPMPNDFSIAAFPVGLTLARGTSLVVTVSTAVTSGVPQSIALAISGLPAGVSGSFSPAIVSAGGSAILTLTVSPSAAAGSANATIQGVATSGSQTTSVSVTVAP